MKAIDLQYILYLNLFTMVVLSLCSCGNVPVAGGTTDSGNATIAGLVVTDDQRPVAGANVFLYSASNEHVRYFRIDSTRSAQDGSFVFQKVPMGIYQIISYAVDSTLIAHMSDVFVEGNSKTELPPAIASPASSISGAVDIVPSESLKVTVWLKETPFYSKVDASGQFSFSLLPAGTYEIAVMVSDSVRPLCVVALDTVTVDEGMAVDNLVLERFEPIAKNQDSLVLDAFYDRDAFNSLGGAWWSYFDNEYANYDNVRDSAYFDSCPEENSTESCALVSLFFDTTHTYGGLGTWFMLDWNGYPQVVDFSEVSSLSFYARGTVNRIEVELWSPFGKYVQIHSFYSNTEWEHYTIDLTTTTQEWNENTRAEWDAHKQFLAILQFTVWRNNTEPDTANLWIDNVTLHK